MAGPIKSIQKVAITIASGSTSNTATISSVTTSNAILLFNGNTTTQTTNYSSGTARIELTNGTTVTAYRGASNSDTVTIYGTVIEFNTGYLNSVQSGTVALSTSQTTNTATISTVGANAFVIWLGTAMATSQTGGTRAATSAVLTNSTTVTCAQSLTGTAMTVGYMVVDPTASLVSAIQQVSYNTGTTNNTSYTRVITSVDTTKAILIDNGSTIITTSTVKDEVDHTKVITNATTVTMTRGDGGAAEARTVNFTVVTFAAGILNSGIQRGAIALSASTTNTATITSVNASLSAVNYNGNIEAAANAGPYDHYQALRLTNATTVTGSINTAANAASIAFEVIEFSPGAASTLFGVMPWENAPPRHAPAPQDASLQRQVSANYFPYPPEFNQAWDTPKRRDTGQMDSIPNEMPSGNRLPEYQPWDNVPRRRDTGQMDSSSQRQATANYFPNAPQAQMPWETPKRRDTGQMDMVPNGYLTPNSVPFYESWCGMGCQQSRRPYINLDYIPQNLVSTAYFPNPIAYQMPWETPKRRDTGQMDATSQRQATANYYANPPQAEMPWESGKRRDTGQMDFFPTGFPTGTYVAPLPVNEYQPWDSVQRRRDTGQMDALSQRLPTASPLPEYQPWETPLIRERGQRETVPARIPGVSYFPLPPNSLMPWETPKRRDNGQLDATSSYVPKANVFPSAGAFSLGWELFRGPLRGQYDAFSSLEPTIVTVTPPFIPPSGTTYGMVFIGDGLKYTVALSDSPATMTFLSVGQTYTATLSDIAASWVLASDSLTYTCTLEEISMNTYDIGSMVQLSALFTDTSGNVVAPSSVVVRVKDPNGTVGTYTPKAQADGSFAYGYTTAVVGVHYYRFEGSGSVVAVADGTFNVTQSPIFAS